MAKRSPKTKNVEQPSVAMAQEVTESLWRVLDAARFAISPPHGTDKQELLEFLADQEKMLRRAIAFFHGPDGENVLRQGLTKHPYIITLEQNERERHIQILKDARDDND